MHVASFALLYSHSPTRGTLRRLTGCTYEVLPVANSPSRLEVAQIVCETHVRSTWQIVGAGRRNTHGLTLANMQNWQQAHQHYLPDLRNIIAVEGAHVTDPGSQFNKANNINTHTHTRSRLQGQHAATTQDLGDRPQVNNFAGHRTLQHGAPTHFPRPAYVQGPQVLLGLCQPAGELRQVFWQDPCARLNQLSGFARRAVQFERCDQGNVRIV